MTDQIFKWSDGLSGDMQSEVYDPDKDGIVEQADAIAGVEEAGSNQYYGTNAEGEAGFHALPEPDEIDPSGWMDADETWTYVSTTTFTVPGDQTGKYAAGTRVKYVQSGNVKYGVVIGAAYSDPSTTITITGGTDYALTNAEISEPQISYQDPPDWPGWFNWTPSWSCSGSMTFTVTSLEFARFSVRGNTVLVVLRAFGTTGGSASISIYASLPVQAQNPGIPLNGVISEASIMKAGLSIVSSGTPNNILFRKLDSSNHTIEANKELRASGFFEMEWS